MTYCLSIPTIPQEGPAWVNTHSHVFSDKICIILHWPYTTAFKKIKLILSPLKRSILHGRGHKCFPWNISTCSPFCAWTTQWKNCDCCCSICSTCVFLLINNNQVRFFLENIAWINYNRSTNPVCVILSPVSSENVIFPSRAKLSQ